MSSKSKGKSEALANFAYQASVGATSTATAYGILLNTLLHSLLGKGAISEPELTSIFSDAAGSMDCRTLMSCRRRYIDICEQ